MDLEEFKTQIPLLDMTNVWGIQLRKFQVVSKWHVSEQRKWVRKQNTWGKSFWHKLGYTIQNDTHITYDSRSHPIVIVGIP